jgi:two-component system response regulator YesN
MPDQDGLTMLAGLKSEFPALEVTVLTGYAILAMHRGDSPRRDPAAAQAFQDGRNQRAMRTMSENLRAAGLTQEETTEENSLRQLSCARGGAICGAAICG